MFSKFKFVNSMSVLQNYFRQLQERVVLNLRKFRYRQHFFFKGKCGRSSLHDITFEQAEIYSSQPQIHPKRKFGNSKNDQIVRKGYGSCKSQKDRGPYYTINAPQSKLKLRLSSLSAVIRSIYCIIGSSVFRQFSKIKNSPHALVIQHKFC